MSFALYVTGFVIFIAGAAWALARMGVHSVWIVICCLILAGIGIARGATHTRTKDPSTG
ncbi:MAG: hypothetical protein ACREL5_01060 [Gemmatimonadales bacterium]